MFPQAARLDDEPRIAALRRRVDELHRRAEVRHVQAPLEVARERRVRELDDDAAALRAHVDSDVRVGEIDDDAPFAAAAAAKIDVAERMPAVAGALFREMLRDGGSGAGCRGVGASERDQHRAAVDLRVVAHRPRELEDHARAVARLHEVDAPQVSFRHVLHPARQGTGGIQKIERDPRRVVDS